MFKYFKSLLFKSPTIKAEYSCGLPIGTERIDKGMYPFLFLSTSDPGEARTILKSGKAHKEVMAIISDYINSNPNITNKYKINNLYYDLGKKSKGPNEFELKLYARRQK